MSDPMSGAAPMSGDPRKATDPHAVLDVLPDAATIRAAHHRITELEAVERWAKQQLPVGIHDHVTLTGLHLNERETPGWWAYREALTDGATAVVTDVRFATERGWVVDVELDREWSVGTLTMGGELRRWWNGPGEPPDGYEDGRRGLDDRRHTWALTIGRVERVRP